MTALEAMRKELRIIQSKMNECINDLGFVKLEYKYEYQELVRQAESFKIAIEWMETHKREVTHD